MSQFKLFKPWEWFKSNERKKTEQKSAPSGYTPPEQLGRNLPFRNIYFTGTSIVVVLGSGEVIMKNGVTNTIVNDIHKCTTEQEIKSLLTEIDKDESKPSETETKEERQTINENILVLLGSEDFIIKGRDRKQVYLRDAPLEIPAVIVGSFIELLERIEEIQRGIDKDAYVGEALDTAFEELNDYTDYYEALKMFWYWAALNPIESARNDLFNFIRKNDITITNNGLLEMYRRVVSVEGSKVDKKLVEFISNSYTKVKKWKKAAKNYEIYSRLGDYMLLESDRKPTDKNLYWNRVGNLQVLYNDLSNLQTDKAYTDGHTHSKDIKIGAIYKEDEDKIDLNNQRDCSSGLHVGSRSFGFDGFGDTGVLCLVNPMYVRSVPVSATNKMRVSEMFVVGEMQVEEYTEGVESQKVADYSNEYCSSTLEVLKQAVKDKSYKSISCQGKSAPIGVTADLPSLLKHIEDRVKEVV